MWLAEAVATNRLLLLFPLAIMLKCSKFSNSQIFMIFGLSSFLDPWPQWHKELTDCLRSKPEHQSNIFGTFYNIFYKNIRTSLNVLFCQITFFCFHYFTHLSLCFSNISY